MSAVQNDHPPSLRELLALLPIPAALSTPQREGRLCAWGTEIVSAGTALDLGPRTISEGDTTVTIFPRLCRPCLMPAAMNGLFAHIENCEPCQAATVDEPLGCAKGRGLYHLAAKGPQ